ncbi:MAG: S8 family peptidase [Lachnospiraceae bacterium]
MDQKQEELLTISLESSEQEREKSASLGVGYEADTKRWDVIVKYYGDINTLEEKYPGTTVEILLGGFAILSVSEEDINAVAMEPMVEYMEKPKLFYFGLQYSKIASCIYEENPANRGGLSQNNGLSGKGVLCAIIDSGIDIFDEDFWVRDEDLSNLQELQNGADSVNTRIIALWDQETGIRYNRDEINEAIREGRRIGVDNSGHGTNVAKIACGNKGVSHTSDIVVVKLANTTGNAFPGTIEIMQALDYVVRLSMEVGRPVAINLSFGNNYGAHDGTSILEEYIDTLTGIGQCVICIGAGNEAVRGTHYSGQWNVFNANQGRQTLDIALAVGEFQTSFDLQLWKNYADLFQVEIVDPSGRVYGPIDENARVVRFLSGNTEIQGFYGEPNPYSKNQEVYINFIPEGDYVDSGIWRIRLLPEHIVNGQFELWLPSAVTLSDSTRFLINSPALTLTIPSTSRRAVAVGAYDARSDSYGDFSGRGIETDHFWYGLYGKPDLVAPGVSIVLDAGTLSERSVTGTSFATPFVTGAAARLMQWGIIDGNDPFLYGEKVKAYLIRGARKLPGYENVPNGVTGWGALCLRDSLPG